MRLPPRTGVFYRRYPPKGRPTSGRPGGWGVLPTILGQRSDHGGPPGPQRPARTTQAPKAAEARKGEPLPTHHPPLFPAEKMGRGAKRGETQKRPADQSVDPHIPRPGVDRVEDEAASHLLQHDSLAEGRVAQVEVIEKQLTSLLRHCDRPLRLTFETLEPDGRQCPYSVSSQAMPSITRKTQSSRTERRGEIRDRLRAAVERLMAGGESYTELSVERLVKEAGISRATFYVYFEDKGDLLQALTEDFITRIIEAATIWWELPAEASKDDLRGAMRAIFDSYLPHKVVMSAVVEVASYDAGLAELFGSLLERTIEEVSKHISDGQKQGFVHKRLDPQRTAAWLTRMAERGLYQLVAPASPAAAEKLLTALTDITWNSLYAGTR